MPVEEPVPDAFVSEPSNLDALLEEYYVENKVPGRDPGTSLLLTVAASRSGKESEIVANQKFKLFLVPRQQCNGPHNKHYYLKVIW